MPKHRTYWPLCSQDIVFCSSQVSGRVRLLTTADFDEDQTTRKLKLSACICVLKGCRGFVSSSKALESLRRVFVGQQIT
jgi:hypothetical protein